VEHSAAFVPRAWREATEVAWYAAARAARALHRPRGMEVFVCR
jgi:hypothetical protein